MSATECGSFSLADFTLKQTTFEPFHEDTHFNATDETPLVAYKVRVNFEGNLPLPESECKWTHVGFCYDRPYVEWIHGSFTGNFNADGAPIVTVEWAAAGPLSSTVYDLWRNGKYEIYDISGNSITFAIGGHPDSIDVTHEFGVRAVNLLDGCLSDLVTCTVTVPGDLTECPPEAGEILIKTNIVGPEYNANGDLVGIQIQLVWSGETGSYIKILRSFEGCDGNFSEIGSVSVTQNYFYSTLQSGQIATYKVVSGRNNCDLVGESDCYTINVTPMTGLNEGTVYFYVKDHLGNTRLVLDRDGYIQSRMDYEPYGIELYPLAANTSGEKYKFTNQERDSKTNLDYMHARYYSSAMGRFMGADSGVDQRLVSPQSMNLYAYCWNNPINRNDPDGRIAPAVAALAYAEAAWTVYDAYDTYKTVTDEKTSAFVKTVALLGFSAGLITPGSWGKASKVAAEGGEKVVKEALKKGTTKSVGKKLDNVAEKIVRKGEIPEDSLANQCVEYARKNLADNPGSKLVTPSGSKVGHYAVETPGGMILDPTLRDNLATYGANVSDIPKAKTSFTHEEWEELVKRLPDVGEK